MPVREHVRLRIVSCCIGVSLWSFTLGWAAEVVDGAPHPEVSAPTWVAPELPAIASRISRQEAARIAMEDNASIAQAALALQRAKTQRLRAQGRNDGVFRTALDAMRAQTPVDSGITKGINRQDLLQLNTSLSRRFDTGTTLSVEMQNGYTRTVFPLMISGILQQRIDSGPNYLNALTLSLQQSLLEGRSRRTTQSMDIVADIEVTIAEAQLQAAQEQVVQQVMHTWSQLFFSEIQVVLQERSIERTRRQVDAAQAQLDAGQLAPFERNLIWQRLAQNHEALLIAHKELRTSARALMLLLGRAPHQGLVLTDIGRAIHGQTDTKPLEFSHVLDSLNEVDVEVNAHLFGDDNTDEFIEVHTQPVDPSASPSNAKLHRDIRTESADRWCERAMQSNAQILGARAQLDLAESMLLPAKEQQRAQLDLKFGVTSSGLDPDMGESLKKMATVDALTLFGGLEFVTRLRNRTARAEFEGATIDLATARAQEAHLREQVCYEVIDAFESLILQQERQTLSQWRAQIAYQGLAAESARFEHGRSTVTLVLDALENVDLSELEHLRVRLEEDAAWWSLVRSAGRILSAVGLSEP